MTERQAMDPFETRFTRRVRAYTDPAAERRIDELAIARTAMSSHWSTGWSRRRLGAGGLGRRFAGVRWAVASVAIVLIGVVGVAVVGRSSDSGIGLQSTPATPSTPATSSTPGPAASAGGPTPDVLRHSWQRPYPNTPGQDQWGTGFLVLASGRIDFGIEPGPEASASSITAGGPDTIVATATVETRGCVIGDAGIYRWLLEGKDTVMTLTAISPDACATREEALAGRWVRADFPGNGPGPGDPTLTPGRHVTSAFDPFGDPAAPIRVAYTVPEGGWSVPEDGPTTFVLAHIPEVPQGQPSTFLMVALLAQPRMAADFDAGAACGPVGDAPGVGSGLDDLVAAIRARPGVVSIPRDAVTIGGYKGRVLDLQLAASWTGGCVGPGGLVVALPIVVEAGTATGPVVAIGPDRPVRLILLDLTDGRTMAIVIHDIEPAQPSLFEALVAEAMPIVESFEFQPPTP